MVAVAPDEYAGLLRGAAAGGYTGSSDQPKVVTAGRGACRADVDQIEWGTAPVNVAFLANAMFGGDLPADAKVTGPSNDPTITVDKDGLAAQVAKTLAALGPLAYSAEAVAHSSVKVQVTDLGATGPVGGATVPVSGRYRFEVTLDPGDGAKSSSLTVPIRCTAVNSTNTQVVDSPAAKPAMAVAVNPTYTG